MTFKTSRGFPLPFGGSDHGKGFNFSIFSKHATAVSLCLFSKNSSSTPTEEIVLDPKTHKTGDVWHIFVYDLPRDYHYGWRIDGPYDPLLGQYFDKKHILLDPFAKKIVSSKKWGDGLSHPAKVLTAEVAPLKPFHWDEISHPSIPINELIIYEVHLRAFTQDPSSKVSKPGTFLGFIEKIPHLKSLGINAVEFLPLLEFDERENHFIDPLTKNKLFQFWGYSPISFFALMNRYAVKDPITEFKMLVKELHANGIEVILDMVYNHTAEGNENGPSLSCKGIENSTYYLLGPNGEYYNFSGCGNTVNTNHPVVRELIIDSLRYFVTEMHVDGFRFDLASVLTRLHDGIPSDRPPVIEAMCHDPILAKTKLIAEAWDAAGLYQVGHFPGASRFCEWNGKFRDDVRSFIKGKEGEIGHFATRLSGSSDLYAKKGRPQNSINFITSHDGFTLHDLVSYNHKHNEENGEGNRDGTNENFSWNMGIEGETDDPEILKLRSRQMRNFHLSLMLSLGIPMILSGDEYGHTKKGNNNSWSHDSPMNWFLWDELKKNEAFFRFYRGLIHFRKKHPIISHTHFLKEKDAIWHGKESGKPDWSTKSHFLALSLVDVEHHYVLYTAFNASMNSFEFHLPTTDTAHPWYRIVDTSFEPPEDFIEDEKSRPIATSNYTLPPYSSLLLKREQIH